MLYCRYPEFAPMFKAELWDPDEWASLFKEAGAKCELHVYTVYYRQCTCFNER